MPFLPETNNNVLKPHRAFAVHKSSIKANYSASAPDTPLTSHKALHYPRLLTRSMQGRTYSFECPVSSKTNMSSYAANATSNLSLDPGLFRQVLQGAPSVFDKVRRISRPPLHKHELTYIFTVRHILPVPIHLYSLLSFRPSMSLTPEVPSLVSIRRASNFLSYQSILQARCAGQRSSSPSTYEYHSIQPRLSDVMSCSRVSKDTKVFGLLSRSFQTMTSAPPLWTEFVIGPRKGSQWAFL